MILSYDGNSLCKQLMMLLVDNLSCSCVSCLMTVNCNHSSHRMQLTHLNVLIPEAVPPFHCVSIDPEAPFWPRPVVVAEQGRGGHALPWCTITARWTLPCGLVLTHTHFPPDKTVLNPQTLILPGAFHNCPPASHHCPTCPQHCKGSCISSRPH